MSIINRRKIILLSSLALIAGIAFGSFFPEEYFPTPFFCFFLACFFLVLSAAERKNSRLLLLFLLPACLFLGFWRFGLSIPDKGDGELSFYNSRNLNFRGFVSSEPDIRIGGQKLTLSGLDKKGKVLVSLPLYPRYAYGDILEINCDLKTPEEFNGFSYDRFLARYGIYSVCYQPRKLLKIGEKEGPWINFLQKLFALKSVWQKEINLHLPEPEAGLASAMILGYQRGIGDELRADLSTSGLAHISSISGSHISILSGLLFLAAIYAGLSRKQAFYLVSAFIFSYVALIGFLPPAVRAGIMGFLVLLAVHLGRLNRLGHCLVITAAGFLLLNPRLLRDDIGFELSFLAVLGIVWVYPWLAAKIGRQGIIWDIILVSLAAQIFTWPIVAWNFGVVSLIAPLANILVLWILPALLVCMLLACLTSTFLPFLADIFFFLSYLMHWYVIKVAELTSFGALTGLDLTFF